MSPKPTSPATEAPREEPVLKGLGPGPGQRSMEPVKRAKDTRATLLRLWGYLSRQKASLLLAALFVAAAAGLTLMGPYLLGRAIDGTILQRDLPGLARLCTLMLLVYALSSLATWAQNYIMAGVAQKAVRDIRHDLFSHLQRLPLRFFDSHAHGDLMSRLTNDVENVNQVLTDSVTGLVSGLLGLVGAAALMLLLNVPLALASMCTTALLTLGLNRWLSTRTRAAFRTQQSKLGALNGLIEETIGGQRVVKAYRREALVQAEFERANNELRDNATRAQMFAGFVGPMMNGINNTGLALVAGVGGLMVLHGAATVGTIAAFINYARQFGRPLTDIANLYNTIQSAIAGAERVFEIMDETPETDVPGAQPLPPLQGDVVFEDVSFGYTAGVPILKGISLHAKPGETVALIGPTGAGKTTVINLLTRFYDVDAGRITVDGHDIRTVEKDSLRRQLGIVLQDTFLFGGTVADNIRYGRPDASTEDIIEAAKKANAHAFIHRLPHGYDTPISERGGNLSQGQRQLLAIARAILADPRILILDEATSSVDTRTERHIQEAMRRLMQGRTSFVIAHRLSTIRASDQILVVSAGQIIERGTHEELLQQHGFYFGLVSSSGDDGGQKK
ncbi:putative ABC transporter ATP-binding protein [Abditibacteriota bacterium]|nr:putative ABC transporter ATP-binding protein [Abditibacteriota bacterium]